MTPEIIPPAAFVCLAAVIRLMPAVSGGNGTKVL